MFSSSREPKFGVNLTNSINIPKPVKCSAQIKWSYGSTSCTDRIGCPVLDPRNKLVETIPCDIPLQSGGSIIQAAVVVVVVFLFKLDQSLKKIRFNYLNVAD